MPLVSYSDSENSDQDQSQVVSANPGGSKNATTESLSLKRKAIDTQSVAALPPLPESFHDLYPTAKRKANHDDPRLHSGRQRLTPHVEGIWPSHVYIECEDP